MVVVDSSSGDHQVSNVHHQQLTEQSIGRAHHKTCHLSEHWTNFKFCLYLKKKEIKNYTLAELINTRLEEKKKEKELTRNDRNEKVCVFLRRDNRFMGSKRESE